MNLSKHHAQIVLDQRRTTLENLSMIDVLINIFSPSVRMIYGEYYQQMHIVVVSLSLFVSVEHSNTTRTSIDVISAIFDYEVFYCLDFTFLVNSVRNTCERERERKEHSESNNEKWSKEAQVKHTY